jgi:UDP-N-acetylmuramoyl-tripeptide--D-alanyl-D-alanine ligase
VSKENIRRGLSRYKAPPLRQNIIEENGITVMLDCYNSGPQSLMAAFETFEVICKERSYKRNVLILGGMLELGENSESEHIRLGKAAAEYGIFEMITYGDEARNIALGALIGGIKKVKSYKTNEFDLLLRELDSMDFSECAVLIKGSRAFKMEKLLKYVTKRERY